MRFIFILNTLWATVAARKRFPLEIALLHHKIDWKWGHYIEHFSNFMLSHLWAALETRRKHNGTNWSSCGLNLVQNPRCVVTFFGSCMSSPVVAAQRFLRSFRLCCAFCVHDLFPICQCVTVCSPSPPQVWKRGIPYVISFCQQDWLGVLKGRFGMRRSCCFGTYPSLCLSSTAPPFPSVAFVLSFFSFFSITPASSPTTSGSPQEVQYSKTGWFPPPLLLRSFSPSPELT